MKLTLGRVTALPPAVVSCPVRVIEARNSAGLVPSPVAGKLCVSAQESTGAYALPFHCWVAIEASRTVDQNVGAVTWQLAPTAQLSWV